MDAIQNNLLIEPAVPADFPEIIEVWEASVRATHHFLKEEDIVYFKPLILNEYLYMVKLFCTRDANGKIIGFMGVSEDKIEMLFIDPASVGSGIGRKFMNYAISELVIKKVDVNEQNEQAVGFYKNLGFQVVDRSELDPTGRPYPILHMAH